MIWISPFAVAGSRHRHVDFTVGNFNSFEQMRVEAVPFRISNIQPVIDANDLLSYILEMF